MTPASPGVEHCPVCGAKHKRVCLNKGGAKICYKCCATIRDPSCAGCVYYTKSREYHRDHSKQEVQRDFKLNIKPELEEMVSKALALIGTDSIAGAQALLDEAAAIDSTYYLIEFGRGVIQIKTNNLDEGIASLDRAIEKYPLFMEAYFNKGMAFGQKNDIPNMIRSFQKVMTIGEKDNENVVWARTYLRDVERVIRTNEGIDLETFIAAHDSFDKGVACMLSMQWPQAILAFERCARINPHSPKAFANIGLCKAKLGSITESIAAFDRAIELDPCYEPALLNREAIMEGYEIPAGPIPTIEYAKEYRAKKKSLIKEFFDRFMQAG
jgi:tetratricopeptide (TPR) repeat protein